MSDPEIIEYAPVKKDTGSQAKRLVKSFTVIGLFSPGSRITGRKRQTSALMTACSFSGS